MDNEKKTAWQIWKETKKIDSVTPISLLNKNNYIEQNIAEERYSICLQCPELLQLTSQCKKCGCFMNFKTKLEKASCPLGKW